MRQVLKSYIYYSIAIGITTLCIPGFVITGDFVSFLLYCGLFTALALLVKPVLSIILSPFNALTFGLVGVFVTVFFLFILNLLIPQMDVKAWTFDSPLFSTFSPHEFGILATYVLSSLLISTIYKVLNKL